VIISVFLLAEVFFICMAAFFLFRMNGNTFSEAASYAIIIVFMLLSFFRQISFIAGYPIVSTCMEVLFFIASIILIFRQRSNIFGLFNAVRNFGSANLIPFIFLISCFLYMAVHAFLSVPKEFQNELYNISIYEKIGFFSREGVSGFSAFLPVNHSILFNTSLGPGMDSGAGIFSFLAYLSIGFSTYALSRRYSWHSTAFTIAILVISMPRLVVQAIYPGTQIISIAVALFCILAIYRMVERPSLTDLVLLILGLFFYVPGDISSMIFAPILSVLSCVVLFRRHGMVTWKSILGKNYYAFLAVVPAMIFSQFWLKNSWSGVFSSIYFNKDGIQGAAANFIRYLLESFYFSASIDIFFERVFYWNMAQSLQLLYDFCVRPFLGESGASQGFYLAWMPNEMFSFGPVGFFLVLPALFYAMARGPRRLKAVAMAFFAYFYLVSLIIAWAPGNAKFFELFYVCAGFSMAFFFPPWRFTKRRQKNFQTAGCFLLFFTLLTAT